MKKQWKLVETVIGFRLQMYGVFSLGGCKRKIPKRTCTYMLLDYLDFFGFTYFALSHF